MEIKKERKEIGIEIIKQNINRLLPDKKIEILPLIIDALFKNNHIELADEYIKAGTKLEPNSIYFKNCAALQLIGARQFEKALEIYDQMTPRLMISPEHSRLLLNKSFLCHQQGKYEISNYYLFYFLEERKEYLKNDDEILNYINMHICLNFYFLGDHAKSFYYFNKMTNNKVTEFTKQIINGGKANFSIPFFAF